MPRSCEIQSVDGVGGGFSETPIKMHFRSVVGVPPSVPCRPSVPPTLFSDLAFLFSFSAFFGGVAVYLSLLAVSDKGTEVECVHVQVCPTLCDPMDYSPPGPSVHGILQAIKLEWVAISFSRGSS